MGKKVKIEEEVIVKLLAARNEKAMEVLYDNFSAAMYGIIQRIVQDDAVAEDVLQEAFIKIWKNFLQYDAAKGRLFTWIINICRNSALEKIRSKGKTIQNLNQDEEKSKYNNQLIPASYNPDTISVKEISDKLESEYFQVIDLMFFRGYSQSEAAEKLNIPLGTVKTRLHAAIQKIKGLFQKELTE